LIAQRAQATPHALTLIVAVCIPRDDFVRESFATPADQIAVGRGTDADARRRP
jgi:hypothetical protein